MGWEQGVRVGLLARGVCSRCWCRCVCARWAGSRRRWCRKLKYYPLIVLSPWLVLLPAVHLRKMGGVVSRTAHGRHSRGLYYLPWLGCGAGMPRAIRLRMSLMLYVEGRRDAVADGWISQCCLCVFVCVCVCGVGWKLRGVAVDTCSLAVE